MFILNSTRLLPARKSKRIKGPEEMPLPV